MEAKTSEQAYKEYQKLRNIEEKLGKNNRGLNIINSSEFLKPDRFFIEIKKVSKINLVESSSEVIVETNIPFSSYRYGWGYKELCVDSFFEQFEKWVSIPKYKFFIEHNRKRDNKISSWGLPTFRKFNIDFEMIDFNIGIEARHEIKLMNINFEEEVKKLVSKQREATDEEAHDFEKFKLFLERIADLKRKSKSSSSYYYRGGSDSTFKILIDKETYNKDLKIIETELLKLCKKYSFLQMPNIDYKEINRKLSFEDWKVSEKKDSEEEWEEFDDEDKEEYDGNFEQFLEERYNNYLESNDFDESNKGYY